jgi:hypothetical protein
VAGPEKRLRVTEKARVPFSILTSRYDLLMKIHPCLKGVISKTVYKIMPMCSA